MFEFHSVGKGFDDGTAAVDGVDLRVRRGEFCVLLGPSGSGKSTLLGMVNGLITPTSGSVSHDGTPLVDLNIGEIRCKMGMIHQQLHLVPRLSVLGNVLSGALPAVSLWRSLLGLFPIDFMRKACNLLQEVDLDADHLYRRASTLSGGQQQRVAIARAFMLDPEIVLADEPVASLDPANSRMVLQLLKGTSRRHNASVLCSLHHLELAMEFADRVVALCKGKVIYEGPPSGLTRELLDRIYGVGLNGKSAPADAALTPRMETLTAVSA